MLAPSYVLGVLLLDATGTRIGEPEAAKIGGLDESCESWLVRAKVAKMREPRWVQLPDDLFAVVVSLLPAREDRDLKAPLFPIGSADRLRMAIGRACRDAGVPSWSPHHLRHRRISLLHHQGESWAEIGAKVGQRNLSVTADAYSHAPFDYRDSDRAKLLERARMTHTRVHTSRDETGAFAGTFSFSTAHHRNTSEQARSRVCERPREGPLLVRCRNSAAPHGPVLQGRSRGRGLSGEPSDRASDAPLPPGATPCEASAWSGAPWRRTGSGRRSAAQPSRCRAGGASAPSRPGGDHRRRYGTGCRARTGAGRSR